MNRQIFENIRQLKRELIPDERLILFGSQARGDARPDSDWDLLLLTKKENEKDLEDRIFKFVLMGWNYETYLSIKIYNEEEWEKCSFTPFYKNVEKEGWINEFMSIPMEYHCNPFDINPSGDLFFANKEMSNILTQRHSKSGTDRRENSLKPRKSNFLSYIEETSGHRKEKPRSIKGDKKGQWSRRITQKHRLIYEIHNDIVTVVLLTAWGHYGEK
ncbi:MAG: type II toxin-antitoxin system YoeB family toxin [Dysgonamonadaceae bacterium]|jgi:Txe/YoeB family toxin of toxin-antitoxin system|nr:type II toxin-antitoxin system YoeB family toxin [Dysgonamonadaceae bacterium]